MLNATFAREVAKLAPCENWTHLIAGASMIRIDDSCGHEKCYPFGCVPKFTEYMDAVMPHLVARNWQAWNQGSRIFVGVYPERGSADSYMPTESDSLPRAAVIALLKAHGVEVEFTA